MRVMVVYGENASDLTFMVNSWLEQHEKNKVILTISPAMPREKDGAYITITYTDKEKVFEKIQ